MDRKILFWQTDLIQKIDKRLQRPILVFSQYNDIDVCQFRRKGDFFT